ncbi:MAG TPA: response regulator, partial [Pyrinomonadaceae bacterium]|nr:response regulator [Pyrinomonadaceae bacterium]
DEIQAAEQVLDPYATVNFSTDQSPESRADHVVEAPSLARGATEADCCPFCGEAGQAQAFECEGCHAVLSLSDLEAVLSNDNVHTDIVSRAVIRLEHEWESREFGVDDMTKLALGHLNLGSFDPGRNYLRAALQLDPNNVVLASQLNALAIRLDEMDRQREIDEARPKGKNILVVDDSATVRKLISGKLEKSGHNVISACDGIEALERIKEQVPDLVLLDITMPRMDGYEVCKQIRANPDAGHVPVVMISGKDGFFDKVRGRMAGTTAYVTKPFGPETLMRALEMYLLPDAPVHEAVEEYEIELEPVV